VSARASGVEGGEVTAKVLVMGAGNGAANNLVASLRSALSGVRIVGCHDDAFILKKSAAEQNYLLRSRRAIDEVLGIVQREHVDVVIPTGDGDVALLSDHREALGSRVFLPAKRVIDLCQDKLDLTAELARHDVPVPVSLAVTDRDRVEEVVAKLAWSPRLWCRMRSGSRSLGATPVATAEHVKSWLLLWKELRGVPPEAFMLAEHLPGRDFLCQSLWRHGRLVLVKTFERISYFGGENSPSGVSSLSSLAKTVVDARVVDVCTRAVTALDPDACGAFSIDLKENREGVPCITEINAGRFFIGMTAFDHVGAHNMSATFVRLALGEELALAEPYDCPPDYYLVRDLDTPPGVYHADEIVGG
jgi:carbamoyl-phosphate synthase large subunit